MMTFSGLQVLRAPTYITDDRGHRNICLEVNEHLDRDKRGNVLDRAKGP